MSPVAETRYASPNGSCLDVPCPARTAMRLSALTLVPLALTLWLAMA